MKEVFIAFAVALGFVGFTWAIAWWSVNEEREATKRAEAILKSQRD